MSVQTQTERPPVPGLPRNLWDLYTEEATVVEEDGCKKVIRDGLIERTNTKIETEEGGHQGAIRIIACPVCGFRFEKQSPDRPSHFKTHNPEDFGLSPIESQDGGEQEVDAHAR